MKERTGKTTTVRRRLAQMLAVGTWIAAFAGSAYAHGTMPDADEFGPPMMISGTLGIIGYFAMMFWPTIGRMLHRQAAHGGDEPATVADRRVAKAR